MGLERISAVLQNVVSNYEIDLFKSIIFSAAKILKITDLKSNSLSNAVILLMLFSDRRWN